MKARCFVIFAILSLLTPAYASADEVMPTNVTYEKMGNVVYATGKFFIDSCKRRCQPYVDVILRCPTGYLALSGGYQSADVTPTGAHRYSLYEIWADEPTKDRIGWLIGTIQINVTQEVDMTVTCALPTQ